MMVEKRARKFQLLSKLVPTPELEGPEDADVTIVGWGSTYGVIKEAIPQLAERGITANHLPIKWIVPLKGDEIVEILSKSKKTIMVENNYSGQFHRYLRSETGFSVDGHVRKYDGEPFMPHHVTESIMEILSGATDIHVPYQEVIV